MFGTTDKRKTLKQLFERRHNQYTLWTKKIYEVLEPVVLKACERFLVDNFSEDLISTFKWTDARLAVDEDDSYFIQLYGAFYMDGEESPVMVQFPLQVCVESTEEEIYQFLEDIKEKAANDMMQRLEDALGTKVDPMSELDEDNLPGSTPLGDDEPQDPLDGFDLDSLTKEQKRQLRLNIKGK